MIGANRTLCNMKIGLAFISLFFAVMCTGCSTILTHTGTRDEFISFRGEGVYQGVRLDSCVIAHAAPEDPLMLALAVFDFPLSAIADTILLPYDISQSAGR